MWIIYIIQKETESREDRNPLTPLAKRQHCFQPRHSQAPSNTREMLDSAGLFWQRGSQMSKCKHSWEAFRKSDVQVPH